MVGQQESETQEVGIGSIKDEEERRKVKEERSWKGVERRTRD